MVMMNDDECVEEKDDLVVEKNEIKTETATVKEEIHVNATVTIENSVNEVFSKGDFKSIENIVFAAKHLRENIVNLEAAGEMSSRQSRNGRFKLMLNLKLLVKTRNLWENPRSYIFKHLGQRKWAKEDGTRMNISRIHVKY